MLLVAPEVVTEWRGVGGILRSKEKPLFNVSVNRKYRILIVAVFGSTEALLKGL